MKTYLSLLAIPVMTLTLVSCGHDEKRPEPTPPRPAQERFIETTQVTGPVKALLMNPSGEMDGFILEDGQQVNFPPHLSADVAAIIKKGDRVAVEGERENVKVVRAMKMTNTGTSRFVAAVGPEAERPVPPHMKAAQKEVMKKYDVKGNIKAQLYGKEGEVTGVVLSDDSVVRFPQEVLEKSKANLEVGKKLKASGYGTKTPNGIALDANTVTNM